MKKKNQAVVKIQDDSKRELLIMLLICLCVTAVLFICHSFTGQWIWKSQPYNSYILQAQSWLQGRLDLGENYSHLEIAVFNGKYYISFPPFPSYVMLPFVACHLLSFDGIIAFAFSLAGSVYAYKIMRHCDIDERKAAFFALFLTVGSNWLMTAQNAWVWFIAQNMAFTLSLMAIYYALKNKAGLSLALWACAVGCRPFQALYLPVLIFLIYKSHMEKNPEDTIKDILKKRYAALIPMAVIALSYMILNFARFSNPLEFGHNYLPEHTSSQYGQFHYTYLWGNIKNLFRLPALKGKNNSLDYPQFNGMCIFMVSPIFLSYVIYLIRTVYKKEKVCKVFTILIPVLIALHLVALCAHVQLGGSHFGNRYPSDALPFLFLSLAAILPKKNKLMALNYPLFFMGLTLNVLGTVLYYLQYYSK